MKQKPSHQWYTQDFLASTDVQMMNAEEIGCYCLLLFNLYVSGGEIENDDAAIQRLCRGIVPSHRVMRKFYTKNNFLRNARVDDELKKQGDFVKKQTQNAKKRWQKEEKHTTPQSMPPHKSGMSLASNRHIPNRCSSSSSSSSINPPTPQGGVEVFKKLKKWFSEMNDVVSPEQLAKSFFQKYPEKDIARALKDPACTSRAMFSELLSRYPKQREKNL